VSPQTTNFYSNIAGSYQVVASVFPVATPVTYALSAPVPGLSLSLSGLLTGTLTTSATAQIVLSSAGVASPPPVAVTVTVVPVPISAVASPASLLGYYVGQTIPTTTITFSSPAYPSGNFIVPNGVTITGLPPGLVSSWVYPSLTATIFGTIYSPGSSGTITITVNIINGASSSSSIPYTFLNDTCTFSTLTPSPFVFSQNAQITPITFTGSPASGLPIAYYYATGLPDGLYVSPGGIIQGAPTTVASNQPFGTIFATTGTKFANFTVTPPGAYFYTVLSDSALLTATPTSYALTVSSPIPTITISNQTASGIKLSNTYYSQGVTYPNTMTFTSYSYGLIIQPLSISGTLGTGTYPNDVVLPASVVLTGALGPNSIPTAIGLSNSNPQIINRFIAGFSSNTNEYSIFNDGGTYAFSSLYTQSSTGLHRFRIISNATSTLSAWSGSLVLVDGTANTRVSTRISPPVFSSANTTSIFIDCTYSTLLNSWVAYSTENNGSLYFSPSATVSTNFWSSVTLLADLTCFIPSPTIPLGGVIRGNVVQMFGNILMLAGDGNTPLVIAVMPTVPTAFVTLTNIASTAIVSGGSVYDIATSPTRAVAAGNFSGCSLASSIDGITWTATTGSFSMGAFAVVYSGLPAVGWLALGYNGGSLPAPTSPCVAWSPDGAVWSQINFGFADSIVLGPAQFDGTFWCFFVSTPTSGVFTLYQHDALTTNITNTTTWTTRTITLPGMTSISSFPTPIYTIVGVPQPVVFVGATPTGPAFTSPTVLNYPIYQYVVIPPIIFAATPPFGQAVVYFLASTLPPGMVWNPLATSLTASITGRSVQLGTFTVSVYALSTNGISLQTIQFVVSRVPIIPTLPSAAEYTSYVREKVIADGATSAVNNHITPFEVGTFALERPPVITLAPELCCTTIKNIN
jgi:hypothetical protein